MATFTAGPWGFTLLRLRVGTGLVPRSVLGLEGLPVPAGGREEGGWEAALVCPCWQDRDSHGSGSSDFISSEAAAVPALSECHQGPGRSRGSPVLTMWPFCLSPCRQGRAAHGTLRPGTSSSQPKELLPQASMGESSLFPLPARCFGKELVSVPAGITPCPQCTQGPPSVWSGPGC